MDWPAAARLVRRLASPGGKGPVAPAALLAGVRRVLDNLEDFLCDLPKADQHVASMLAGPIVDGAVGFAELGAELRAAGPDGEVGVRNRLL